MSQGAVVIEEPFLEATFKGKRFDRGKLPLNVVGDLLALNDLLADLAREQYLAENPGRKRLPRGYRPTTALRISAVHQGSAVVLLERPTNDRLPLDVITDPLEGARELVLKAVHAAANNGPLPSDFPDWARGRFNKIGRGLATDDSLQLTSPRSGMTARYDRTVRRNLVGEVAAVEDDFFAVGSVQAMHADAMSFRIATADSSVDGSFLPELDPDFRDAIALGRKGARYLDGTVPFRIDGTAKFRGSRMVGFEAESITQVEFTDGDDTFAELADRVTGLTQLEPGWLDGDGESVSEETAELFLSVLVYLADLDQPSPAVFPTTDGGLRAEWQLGGQEIVWETDPSGGHYYQQREIGTLNFAELDFPAGMSAADVAEKLSEAMGTLEATADGA